ncbi:MAG: hypothetical protein M1820_007184 [Bogoriella megaspora]|nr:MAG: hypothetical protein M1820_007184 [Bogoriella megaspora]
MKVTSYSIVGLGLTAQQVAATWGWKDAPSFNCPSNTNNHCNPQQAGGFDWSGLNPGSFSSYGGLGFSGFECKDGSGRRDLSKRNGFQSKCIAGSVGKKGSGHGGPAISSGKDQEGMSITGLQVSSDEDTDIECHYHMPDNSICKQTSHCSKGGSNIRNSQCGGAKSVSFVIPATASHHSCSFSIHSMTFDCSTASSTVPPSSYSTPSSAYSTPSIPATSASTTAESSIYSTSAPTPSSYSNTVPSISVPTSFANSTVPAYSTTSSPVESGSSTVPVYSTPSSESSVESSSVTASVPSTSAGTSSIASIPETQTTVIVQTTLTTCPVGQTVTQAGSTTVLSTPSISTIYSTTTSTICTKCTELPSSAPTGYTSAPVNSVPSGPSSAPVNSTPSGPSTAPVYSAPSDSASAGASSSASPSAPAPSAPCPSVLPACLNTWMWMSGCKDNTDKDCFCQNADYTTQVVKCVSSYGADQSEIQSALNYFAGICAAHLSTQPAIITACPSTITLGGAPPATSAPGIPVSAGGSSAEAPPQPSTIYSTQEVTITSCAPEVTNCPASSTVVQTSTIPVSVVPVSAAPSSPAISAPAGSAPAGSAPIGSVPASAGASIPAAAPPAASAPVTTITVSTSVVVPCTYTTGASVGLPIPSSSTTSSIATTVTIPQVQFTSSTVTAAGTTSVSAGLAAGTPPSVPAGPTSEAAGAGSSAVPTSFASVPSGVAGVGTGTFPSPAKPSSSAPLPGNASAGVQISANGFFISAAIAAAIAFFM